MSPIRRTVLKLLTAAAFIPRSAFAAKAPAPSSVDWPSFLARHDLVWDRMPKAWDEGPFLGNGMMGAMLYYDENAGAIRIDLGRSDVQDHRTPLRSTGYDRARLPIGHFLLRTDGRITGRTAMRLKLHDAMLTGTVQTDRGIVAIRAYVHADDMVLVVQFNASGGERNARWEWVGEEAISPRQKWGIDRKEPKRVDPNYRRNPKGARARDGKEELWLQPLLSGGGTATAWRQEGGKLIASVMHDFPGDGAREQALDAVRRSAADASLERRHMRWWHDYYPASFLSIPDTQVESFYWIQMYKLASATRGDRAYVDNQGPWLQPTAWPYATWNLNVQLIYWPMIASNRMHLAGSLIRTIHDNQQQLIDNVELQYRSDSASFGRSAGTVLESPVKPPVAGTDVKLVDGLTSGGGGNPPEMGNLPWALHDIWLVWRHSMDDAILKNTLFPVLRRTTNYYRHFLTPGKDGRLHLPPTYSPEYGSAPDLNYDLALLQWSCAALIDAAERLGIDDPLIPEWRRIRDELADYPKDASGYMIGAGLPLKSSHRHYSHMLMIYPLYLVNRDQRGARALIERSLAHWQSMPAMLRGYSSTGASSISAALGKGDDAIAYLKSLFDEYLRPNTFYKESGPVIETPLSGAQSIHDMLLQSWGGVIRPLPAVPSTWQECVFTDMSAQGGFLVSARRQAGQTAWIRVESRAGEPFVIEIDIAQPVAVVDGQSRPLERAGAQQWRCHLAKGETILIYPSGAMPDMKIVPVQAGVMNSFGLNANSRVRQQRDMSL